MSVIRHVYTRSFECYKRVTLNSVEMRIPLIALKAEELHFRHIRYNAPGDLIILEFERTFKDKLKSNNKDVDLVWGGTQGTEYLQKSEPIWR